MRSSRIQKIRPRLVGDSFIRLETPRKRWFGPSGGKFLTKT